MKLSSKAPWKVGKRQLRFFVAANSVFASLFSFSLHFLSDLAVLLHCVSLTNNWEAKSMHGPVGVSVSLIKGLRCRLVSGPFTAVR